MGSTRRLWLVGLTCSLVLVAAGIGVGVAHNRSLSCTLIGPGRMLAVEIDPSLRHELTTIRVRLTQGDRDESVEFVPKPTNKYRVYIERGVFLDDGAYRLDLGSPGSRGALDADWDADERAHVVVEGLSYSGKKIFRHDERFTFDAHYPNGRACDKDDPGFSHLIRVAERDLL